MEVHRHLCDSCLADRDDLGHFTNGRGEGLELCQDCVRGMVLKLLKMGLWVPRRLCHRCGGDGHLQYKNTTAQCPYCCR